jgi:hypothetical protein
MGSQGKEAVECRGSPLANAKEFSLSLSARSEEKDPFPFPKSERHPVTATLQEMLFVEKINHILWSSTKKDRYSLGWMHSNHYSLQ